MTSSSCNLSSLGPTRWVGDAATDYVLVPRRELDSTKVNISTRTLASGADNTMPSDSNLGNLSKPSLTDPQGIRNSTDVKDEKEKPTSLVALSRSVMSTMAGRRGARKPFRFNTGIRFSGSGSTSTFYAPTFPLLPNSASVTESAALLTLFDEARCLGITIHARVDGTAAIGSGSWAVVFDPANSGNYTSVIGALLARQHAGPVAYNQSSSTVQATTMTKTGYHSFSAKALGTQPTAGASSASEGVGANWFSTSDVGAIIGYLKFACDVVTGQAVTVDALVVYHMEYRSRT